MTPPEHLFLGISCANVYYGAVSIIGTVFRRRVKPVGYFLLMTAMGIAAMLPDVDSFFGHYTSADPWVGHRGMTHSYLGSAVLGLAVTLVFAALSFAGFRIWRGYWKLLRDRFYVRATGEEPRFRYCNFTFHYFLPLPFMIFFVGTFIAGVSHALADLPQPASAWNGVPLMFPKMANGQYAREGGWGMIGWFDLKIQWDLMFLAAYSLPVALAAKFVNYFRFIATRALAALVFAGLIYMNVQGMNDMVKYIKSCEYKNDNQWYSDQMKYVDNAEPFVRDTTKKGMKMFIAIFRQARNYNY